MNDELLRYYNSELSYVRKLAGEFARAYPTVAARLAVDGNVSRDPYVERLIEAFAYVNARTRMKLDDDFPEIAEAMLGVLYPHYLAPTPSVAIAQFALDPGQATMFAGYSIARGARLTTEEVDGVACEFRTCFPVRLYPLRVTEAALVPIAAAPASDAARGATAAVRVKIETYSAQAPLKQMQAPALRFYLGGEGLHANSLYELLFASLLDVAVATGDRSAAPLSLGRDCVESVGFRDDEALFPRSARTLAAYQQLTEYFVLPEKFRFIDVRFLDAVWPLCTGNSAELYFYLRRTPRDLAANISAGTFCLGCAPIVNLFERRAEPIRLTHTRSEHRVVPDARWASALEVYSIDQVTAMTAEQKEIPIPPLYSTVHAEQNREQRIAWHARRRTAGYRDGDRDRGTEIDLTFVDPDSAPGESANWTIDVQTTCLNRDLPAKLPFTAGRPLVQAAAGGPLAPIRLLTQPTPTYRRSIEEGGLWRLVSHLSLNHLSLVEGSKGAAALAEMLRLYEPVGSSDRAAKIQGLAAVGAQRHTALTTLGDAGLCRGLKVRIDFDEQRFADNSMFLFAAVLERFLACYCSINSFSQLEIHSQQRGEKVYEWPPRTGHKQLL